MHHEIPVYNNRSRGAGADVNEENADGSTILHNAARWVQMEIAELLILPMVQM